MARLDRLFIPGLPQHAILQGLPDVPFFRDDIDLRGFAETLRLVVRETGLAIHAYAWLPEALHILATPRDAQTLSATFQSMGRRYVASYNRRHGRLGPLWDGRYRATVVQPEQHLLFLSRLIESLAGDGNEIPRRSSFAHHVGWSIDPLMTDHALYWALGNTPFERQRRYRGLFEQGFSAVEKAEALAAPLKGWVRGDPAFIERCERLANRRVQPLRRGRPRKADPASQSPDSDLTLIKSASPVASN